MRIAHISATFPPYVGGTGNVCFYNAVEQAKLGHEVAVFTSAYADAPSEEIVNRVKVYRLKPLFRFGNAPFLPGLLKINGFDIIHLHHPFIFGTELVSLLSILRGIPFVISHHNDLIARGFKEFLFRVYSFFSVPICFSLASRLGVVSSDYLHFTRLKKWFDKYPNKVVEFSNGVDIDLFNKQENLDQVRKELQINSNTRVFLFVGTLDKAHESKRLGFLLDCLVALPENVNLLVAGDGALSPGFKEYSKTLNISDRVRFLGSVDYQELPKYYSLAEVLILPSLYESFGLVVVEAMACKTPVIASNIPGVRTLINDGVDGLMFDPESQPELVTKILELLNNPKMAEDFSRIGYEKVINKYSWGQVVQKITSNYEDVLSIE